MAVTTLRLAEMLVSRIAILFGIISAPAAIAKVISRRASNLVYNSHEIRDEEPTFTRDPDAPKDCTLWYGHEGTYDCDSISDTFSISKEEFILWVSMLKL